MKEFTEDSILYLLSQEAKDFILRNNMTPSPYNKVSRNNCCISFYSNCGNLRLSNHNVLEGLHSTKHLTVFELKGDNWVSTERKFKFAYPTFKSSKNDTNIESFGKDVLSKKLREIQRSNFEKFELEKKERFGSYHAFMVGLEDSNDRYIASFAMQHKIISKEKIALLDKAKRRSEE